MKLPNNTNAIPIGRDSRRFHPERRLAFEVYGPFGRRIGIWSKTGCGTYPDPEDARQVSEALNGKRRWLRLVTY